MSKKSRGWNLYKRKDHDQWVLQHKDSNGKWRERRVPRDVKTRKKAEEWAKAFLEERRRLAVEQSAAEARGSGVTFKELGDRWTSGELHRLWPDHVKRKKSVKDDVSRLRELYKSIGDIPLKELTPDDVEAAMRSLPARVRTAATRRQYAQAVHMVLSLAVWRGPQKVDGVLRSSGSV